MSTWCKRSKHTCESDEQLVAKIFSFHLLHTVLQNRGENLTVYQYLFSQAVSLWPYPPPNKKQNKNKEQKNKLGNRMPEEKMPERRKNINTNFKHMIHFSEELGDKCQITRMLIFMTHKFWFREPIHSNNKLVLAKNSILLLFKARY